MSRLTGKELANELGNFVNVFGNEKNEDEFINTFCSEHRTLQQSGMRLMLKVIERIASDDFYTDARNEQSKEVAKKMLIGFKKEMQKQYISEGTSPERAKEYTEGEFGLPHRYLGTI